MRHTTRIDHEQRIEEAIWLIMQRLDDTVDARELADSVSMSRFHFHRVFQALTGETVGEMLRRLRLERAAHLLITTRTPITRIALDAGYATHEAFIRAIRAAFACTPSALRRHVQYRGVLPSPNGVHWGSEIVVRFVKPEGATTMTTEIRNVPPMRAACMAHVGPYFMIGQTFGKLGAWMARTGTEAGQGIALYYDDPETTPPAELRSDAGMIVSATFTTDDPDISIVEIPGGLTAVYTHVGPYSGLQAAWNDLFSNWLPTSGYTLTGTPGYELYINNMGNTPEAELITEIHLPVWKVENA